VGERNCAFSGCNALEFRNTEYCLRHKDAGSKSMAPPTKTIVENNYTDQREKNTYGEGNFRKFTWFVIGIIFLPLLIFLPRFPISIIPMILIFGLFLDFRKNGWKFFTLGLLTSIIIFVSLICIIFVIFITNPGSSGGTWN
tara:strand:- start:7773 stop:8195 length:423 start_codon:yes stop_codon:yes gene_type:complete